MEKFLFVVNGIESAKEFDGLKDDIQLNAVQAINKLADKGRKMAADKILAQVNFGAQYLAPGNKRLYVSKKAKRGDMEAVITARGRPTSLARFVTSGTFGTSGVTVSVGKGKTKRLRQAFLIKLRAGSEPIETRFNMGLAVRLKPGDTLRNKKNVVQLQSNLYVLYGPSVSQVFLDRDEKKGVSVDIAPDLLDGVVTEFMRLLEVKHG